MLYEAKSTKDEIGRPDDSFHFIFYFYVLSRHFYTRVKRSKSLNDGDNGENPGAVLFPDSSAQRKSIHK